MENKQGPVGLGSLYTVFLIVILAFASGIQPALSLTSADSEPSWFGIRPVRFGMGQVIFDDEVENRVTGTFLSVDIRVRIWALLTNLGGTSDDTLSVEVFAGITATKTAMLIQSLKITLFDFTDNFASESFRSGVVGTEMSANLQDRCTLQHDNANPAESEASTIIECRPPAIEQPPMEGRAWANVQAEWTFHDLMNDLRHSLRVTVEMDHDRSHLASNTRNLQTSVLLQMIPGDRVVRADFEGGMSSEWTVGDSNLLNGQDYWGAGGMCPTRCYEGGMIAWVAGTQIPPGTQGPRLYDNNMDSFLTGLLRDTGIYERYYLYLKLWVDTEPEQDYLSVQYYDVDAGTWLEAERFSGHISPSIMREESRNQWLKVRLDLPSTLGGVKLLFHSGETTAFEGVYVDDISLFGVPPRVG